MGCFFVVFNILRVERFFWKILRVGLYCLRMNYCVVVVIIFLILLSVCNGIVKVLVRFSIVDKLFCKIYFFVFFMVFDFWSDLSEDFNL